MSRETDRRAVAERAGESGVVEIGTWIVVVVLVVAFAAWTYSTILR